MSSQVPKQFLEIGDLPILCHTINAFSRINGMKDIIVVLPEDQFDFWKNLCLKRNYPVKHSIVTGGNTRYQSVKNGLQSIQNKASLVAIHDGVRPFIDPEIIEKSFESAEKLHSGVVAAKPKESIRKKVGSTTVAKNRDDYFSIQTPQTFRTNEIYTAYQGEEKTSYTDDASVAEDFGIPINLVEGSDQNIKITTQTDLIFAEALIDFRKQKSEK